MRPHREGSIDRDIRHKQKCRKTDQEAAHDPLEQGRLQSGPLPPGASEHELQHACPIEQHRHQACPQ